MAKESLIMEIRPGSGGEEAALFAADLFRMYQKYAEKKGWKVNIEDIDKTEIGGLKYASINISGEGSAELLKNEGGVHRVQRIPKTEKSGRIHTSAISIAVLPKMKEVSEIEINPSDLRIDTYRASGAGGQHVNVTESAIRVTHVPTGTVVTCQDERSQHKNKEKAMSRLSAALLSSRKRQNVEKNTELRREQIKDADRSDKIRTYNFPQNRVTDHRVGKSWQNLDKIVEGNLEKMLQLISKRI
jgi:peptide chain release factor 1